MQVRNSTTFNFKGYSNVISNRALIGPVKFSFFSAKLDSQDLETWKVLQKKFLKLKKNEFSDTITSILTEFNGIQQIHLNERLLTFNNIPEGSKEETLILKAYTLLAKLSKNIQNKDFGKITSTGIIESWKATHNQLKKLLDSNSAQILIDKSFQKKTSNKIILETFNEAIQETMKKHFKIS